MLFFKKLFTAIFQIGLIAILSFGFAATTLAEGQSDLRVNFTALFSTSNQTANGLDISYLYTVENVSANESEPVAVVQMFQVDQIKALNSSGQLVKVISKGATFNANPFSDGANTTRVGSPADLVAAYPVNADITNTARVVNFKSILPGQKVTYTQNISIQGATPFFCDASGNGPVLTNTMSLSDPNQVANGSNLTFRDSNLVTIVGQSGLANKNLDFSSNRSFTSDIRYTSDTNFANNATSVNYADILTCAPDVEVKKTVDLGLGQLKPNTSALVYTIKVKNIGNMIAKSVVLRDTLPVACVRFNSPISGPTGVVTTDQKNIDYSLGDMTPNQEIIIVFKADVDNTGACKINQTSILSNIARATISSTQFEQTINNNESKANSSTSESFSLIFTPSVLTVAPGENFTYGLTLDDPYNNFKNQDAIIITLPIGTTYQSINQINTDGIVSVTGNTVKLTVNDGITTGSILQIFVKANTDLKPGDLTANVVATSTDGKTYLFSAVVKAVATLTNPPTQTPATSTGGTTIKLGNQVSPQNTQIAAQAAASSTSPAETKALATAAQTLKSESTAVPTSVAANSSAQTVSNTTEKAKTTDFNAVAGVLIRTGASPKDHYTSIISTLLLTLTVFAATTMVYLSNKKPR